MEKQRKNILLVCVIMVILIVVSIILSLQPKEDVDVENKIENIVTQEDRIKRYIEDKVIPQGIYEFTLNYEGTITRNELYDKLNEVVNYMANMSTMKNESRFYNKNQDEVKKKMGIETEEEFTKLCSKIKEKDISNTKFAYCQIQTGSFKQEGVYTKFNMIFNYENETQITLEIGLINNRNGIDPDLKVSVIE